MTHGSDSNLFLVPQKITNHPCGLVGFAGTGWTLDWQYGIVQYARFQSRWISQQKITARAIQTGRIDAICSHPGAEPVKRVGHFFCVHDVVNENRLRMQFGGVAALLDIESSLDHVDGFSASEIARRSLQRISLANLCILRLESITVDWTFRRSTHTFHEFKSRYGRWLIQQVFVGKLAQPVVLPP